MTPYPPTKIEVFKPSIGEDEIDAVNDVLRSGWIGRGPKVEEFESEWATHIGVPKENVVSVGCATEGLYQIMQELKECHSITSVVMPDNSFIGTASAAFDNGLKVYPCDIDRQTLTTDSEYIAEHMRPKAAIVYQNYGGFSQLSHEYDLNQLADLWDSPLVEDLAHHPMSKPMGDHAVWSFDAMKVLTCGDGGMVYCKDADCAHYIRQATRLGMSSESGQSTSSERWWEFKAAIPGRRSLMNDIGAAIGLVQLRRLPELVARRQYLWESYQKLLDAPIHHWYDLPPVPSESVSASYYTFWLSMAGDGVRDRLAHFLRERGIYTTYRYYSVSRAYNWDMNTPNSHWASDHCLNLPLYPSLTDSDVEYVCDTISEFGKTL